MVSSAEQASSSRALSTTDIEAIKHLKQAITDGKHWYLALLEAIGLWGSAEEACNGRVYRYLIGGEAFDWLVLAERLCGEVDGLLPDEERSALLFYGKPPVNLSPEEVKKLIGHSKYTQYLNYFYGIVVENALILAVKEEVQKERGIFSCNNEHDAADEAYRRIYGASKADSLKRFRCEKGYTQRRSISLTELKEFTYWLFKYRLEQCDKARVASDTRKALAQLKKQWTGKSVWGVLAADKLIAEYR